MNRLLDLFAILFCRSGYASYIEIFHELDKND